MAELHTYQRNMADILITRTSTYLALPVGLGKSAITLTALRELVASGEIWSALVIAPKKVAEHTWPEERELWAADLPVAFIEGTPKQRLAAVFDPAPIHVISIEHVQWLIKAFEGRWPYQALIIDEAQKFKDPASKRFRAMRRVVKHFDRVILLSATPASESLEGLWSQFFLMDQGARLGRTVTSFRDAFFVADYMGWKYTLRPGAEAAIYERIDDVMVSLRAEDYLTLPDRIDNVIGVDLDPAAREAYERLERDFLMPYKGEVVTAANAAVLAGKLLQLSGGSVYDEDRNVVAVHSAKFAALDELIDSANGNPVLVFYGYQHERDEILSRTKGAELLDVDRWNRGEQKVALAHPASAGAGLNLQRGGNVICWFSLPWSLELYVQACGRLHRQGQTREVVIHHLIVRGSIDEDVMAALNDKAGGQDRLLAAIQHRVGMETRV